VKLLTKTKKFLSEIKSEIKKITWPSMQEVYATTIMVIIAVIFFGFYLWSMDLVFGWLVRSLKNFFR